MVKKDFNSEVTKVFEQLKGNMKKFSKDATVIAKKSEQEIMKASKLGKIQFDIVSENLKKEKLYYDTGKKVLSMRGKLENMENVLKPYFQKYRKIETEVRKRKRDLSKIKRNSKNKTE